MKIYAVVGIHGGVPSDIEVFTEPKLAQARGFQLAREFDLVEKPWDWQVGDGEWRPEDGSMRSWHHHWYNDERDVVVAECEVQ